MNSEHCIDGRKCEAKFALPEGKVGSARTTRIFVARIPSSVSDPQFRQYFEQARQPLPPAMQPASVLQRVMYLLFGWGCHWCRLRGWLALPLPQMLFI